LLLLLLLLLLMMIQKLKQQLRLAANSKAPKRPKMSFLKVNDYLWGKIAIRFQKHLWPHRFKLLVNRPFKSSTKVGPKHFSRPVCS